jgi:purine-nucleoside phosphorylase
MLNKVNAAVAYLQPFINEKPLVGIILGTGLGALINDVEILQAIPYTEIPHFPVSTVESHSGRLIIGKLQQKPVLVMQGRFHYYEGYSLEEVTLPVRVMKMLGISYLFISNAAGGLNPKQKVSDLMVISDHINLLPDHPLRGRNEPAFGPRFPDMSDAYSTELIQLAQNCAKELNINLHTGVYAAVQGPSLETKAEYRYLRIIGADAVGMSTVPENIVARHMNIPVFAISVITDMGIPELITHKVTLDDVIAAANKSEPSLALLFKTMIGRL